MRILLDECVTKHLKPFLKDHDVSTISELKWNGIKNGDLIKRAEGAGFRIIITIDKKMNKQQQFLSGRKLALVIFDSNSSDIEVLKEFVPEFLKKLDSFDTGKNYVVSVS